MREGLREVAELAPGPRVVLLGQEPDIVLNTQEPLEDLCCLILTTYEGQRIRVTMMLL